MDPLIEKIKKAKTLGVFDAGAKKALRERLISFMKTIPERGAHEARHTIQRSGMSVVMQFLNSELTPMATIAVIAIVALVGGGTSLVAQGTLPGDVLYPIKVNFNEKVTAAFQLTTAAKANYEAQLAEKRLDEAVELMAEGNSNSKQRVEAEARFEKHADRVETKIGELEARGDVRGAADVASRFEASLKAQEKVLERLEARDRGMESVGVKVHSALEDIMKIRAGLEATIVSTSSASAGVSSRGSSVKVKVAAEGKIGAAENVIAAARRFVESRKEKLGAQATADAETRLTAAEQTLAEARAKVTVELYGEAFNLGNEAIRIAQEARTLVEAESDFNLNIEMRMDEGKRGATTSVETSAESELDVRVNSSGNGASGEVEVRLGL